MAINRGRLHLLNDIDESINPNNNDLLSFDAATNLWKPNKVSINQTIIESVDITVANQTTVVCVNKYEVGNNSTMVFLNGFLQRVGINHDYVEVDSNTIRFNVPLVIGDVVTFRIENLNLKI